MGLFECVYYYYYYFNYEINSKIDFFGLVGSILVSSESLKICSYDIRLAFFLFIYLLYIEISFPAQDELPELDQAKFSYKSLIFSHVGCLSQYIQIRFSCLFFLSAID
jgi:hypothetical protein